MHPLSSVPSTSVTPADGGPPGRAPFAAREQGPFFSLDFDMDPRVAAIVSEFLSGDLMRTVGDYLTGAASKPTVLRLTQYEDLLRSDGTLIVRNEDQLSALKPTRIIFPNYQLKEKDTIALLKIPGEIRFDFETSKVCLDLFFSIVVNSWQCEKYVTHIDHHTYTMVDSAADLAQPKGGTASATGGVQYNGMWQDTYEMIDSAPSGGISLVPKEGYGYNPITKTVRRRQPEGFGILYFGYVNDRNIGLRWLPKTLSGEWACGLLSQGVSRNEHGDEYRGQIVNKRPQGHGVMTLASGERIEGEWADGLPTKYKLWR